MVTLATVEAQLKAVGCQFRFWGRAELRELCQILLPGEKIAQAVNGQYDAGFAMLVATDFRVLLIDKKPKYLTLKDIRYDMITELDFSGRMMNSTIRIYTPNKELRFTSTSAKKLRTLFNHTQHKVMEIRHRFMMQQFATQHQIQNTPPGVAMLQQQYGQNYLNGFTDPSQMTQQQETLAAFQAPEIRQEIALEAASQESDQQAHYPLDDSGAVKAVPDEPAAREEEMHTANDEGGTGHANIDNAKQRLRAAMGHAGLRSIVHNGQIIREYMSVPFQQRWKRRPYGYRRESFRHQPQA